MKVNFAHLREHAQSGAWINFAVFDAHAISGSNADNANLLSQLTSRARAASLRIDQAALVFKRGGQIQFFGSPPLVDYLSRAGIPGWTHQIEI